MDTDSANVFGGALDNDRLCIRKTKVPSHGLLSTIHVRTNGHGHANLKALWLVICHA